ncbi:MAG: SagB/ThcOx family dehydrogenase [Candidatus Eisenbacteria bacterium]|nr:SagB/ThcOx family dehydrogenase [Candidatus Eisenbacteria bacterium]
MPSKFMLFLSPLAVWLLWLLLPLARGSKITRQRLSIGLSLLVLLYFVTVVGTGVFWVAAQELPIFDWHYLPGYILALLTFLHVALHWRNVTHFLRRGAPLALVEPERKRFRRPVRFLAWSLLAVVAGCALYLLGGRQASVRVEMSSVSPVARTSPHREGMLVSPTIVRTGGRDLSLAQLYHEGSSYPARARLPGWTIASRPAPYNEIVGETIALPAFSIPDRVQVFDACAAWRNGTASPDTAAITREEISFLLDCANGITKTIAYGERTFDLRTAPSAGALYPVNVYLVVWRGAGLEPGVYYYQPKQSALVRVREDDSAIWMLFEASGSPAAWGEAQAVVVLTTTFARTGFKYAERAYRYVCMDAGHLACNLALAAATIGWQAPMIARFDDRAVNATLDLDPSIEAAMLMMPVTRARGSGDEPRFEHESAVQSEGSFIELIHGGTCLRRAGAKGPDPMGSTHATIAEASDLALPAPATGLPLYASLRARRSVREHTSAPITAAELSSLCLAAAGEGTDAPARDPLLAGSSALGLYLIVRDVTDVPAGVYRYLPGAHALRPLRDGDFSSDCMRACLQQDFCGTADAVFVKTIGWDALAVPDGDRGYRYASIRAGVMGEGLYLQGTALGIGVCGVGAFQDPDVAAILDLDPEAEVPLYVTAAGR